MATVVTTYISCGCNRTPNNTDWGQNNTIIYGTSNAIAITKPKSPTRVCYTAVGHKGRVNSVRWIRKRSLGAEDEFVSASTDKTCIVWKRSKETFELVGVLSGHTSVVTFAEGIYCTKVSSENARTLIASASVDSTLRIWERKDGQGEFDHFQTVSFGSGFIVALSWILFPETNAPLLACAGDDLKIYLMVEKAGQFVTVQKLIGHEDWIRGLDFAVHDNGDILLASCSQDCFIRIWRISERDPEELKSRVSIKDLNLEDDIKLKENIFIFETNGQKKCYAVSVESVLQGHENWVYSIHWKPPVCKDGKIHQSMCLLSASMDKTMILWEPEDETGVWIEKVRVGTVGGNTLGLYGAVFSSDGSSLLAHGFQGAFHMWHQQQESETWKPGVTVGGHYEAVEDIDWDPESGEFLLSVSGDQTTRLHAYWKAENEKERTWHEIARPQVHGYDMTCLTMLGRYCFASGADEKVARIFEAPKNFLENLTSLCKVDVKTAYEGKAAPEGAKVPALGLSNKAVFSGESQETGEEDGVMKVNQNEQYKEAYFSPLTLTAPPTEEDLLQNTLWPESQKLYGHGYEIFTLAGHPNGTVLATACKAAKAEHAGIILWDTTSWRQLCTLYSHSLTVTQMAFSHNGEYLLSVSRDRTWTIFKHKSDSQPDSDPLYNRIAYSDKKTSVHSRIIWSTSWSHNDKYFVTVSRDKKAVIWGRTTKTNGAASASVLGEYCAYSSVLELPDSITAVDFGPCLVKDKYVVAFGMDDGTIHFYYWMDTLPQTKDSWTNLACLNQRNAHHSTVKRLRFQTLSSELRDKSPLTLNLASCSSDHSVRIFTLSTDS